ncbi:MAG TPA: WecB/TagA/CpsF family glycosyltransferase [Planctomycetota bacterium]|nr:WecB/TagA/CpsF family glycosyltransferase [Planctomycetota bacterium]
MNGTDYRVAIQQLPILGTRIASVTYDEAVASIIDAASAPAPHAYVCACNVHTVSMARRDPLYRAALNGAFMSVPDGMPLVWAHKILGGRPLPDRVYGPTLMLKLCEAAAHKGIAIFLYGGTPDVASQLSEALTSRIAGLKIAGAISPPFQARADDDPTLLAEIQQMNSSGAKLVFVALGAPKQELFMHRHAARIAPLMVGVGAAFNFHAGKVPQAPPWMQDRGLEWLYRFCAEPRRLWSRYLFYNPYFIARLMLQRIGLDGPSRELVREMAAQLPRTPTAKETRA